MGQNNRWLIAVAAMAAVQFSACERSGTEPVEHPSKVERIEGTELSRVILTERAIQRIGLKTDLVRQQEVTSTRTVWGEVVPLPVARTADGNKEWVRVRLFRDELLKIARDLPARVLLVDRDDDDGLTARSVDYDDNDEEDGEDDEDSGEDKSPAANRAPLAAGGTAKPIGVVTLKHSGSKHPKARRLYYAVEGEPHGLVPEQRVRVKLSLAGSGAKRSVVPYSALIYDSRGQTWVYTSPSPRTFVRQKVEVDQIQGDTGVLSDGPVVGTAVASVGAAELYGTEFKVGH
jgi:hypothetical protein